MTTGVQQLGGSACDLAAGGATAAPEYRATVQLVIVNGNRAMSLERRCSLPFVPPVGVGLTFAEQEAEEAVFVESVYYAVTSGELIVNVVIPEEELDAAHLYACHHVEPSQFVARLEAVGFALTGDVTVPIAPRRGWTPR